MMIRATIEVMDFLLYTKIPAKWYWYDGNKRANGFLISKSSNYYRVDNNIDILNGRGVYDVEFEGMDKALVKLVIG